MAFTGEVIEIVKIRWVETGFSGARELHGARRMTIMGG
jgi:hypothetical protein